MREQNHVFPKNGIEIFLQEGLDRPNQVDFARKIAVLAQGFSSQVKPFIAALLGELVVFRA